MSKQAKLWDIDELRSRGFSIGSIVRVYMVNFITYDEAEVFPGPKLNVVIGPNGTGKSTMTHAICLACGGLPSSIGRSDDIREFVKRGKEHEVSFCEVSLLQADSVVTVRRFISTENKGSKWTINGQTSTQTAVKALMKSLNIDVDNLCSFMPQDKVGNFSQQTPQGILKKTLECIKMTEDKNLHQEQMELSNQQDAIAKIALDRDTQQTVVANLQQQINGMKTEVERIRQRDKMIENLHMHQVRLAGLDLKEKTEQKTKNQALVDEANAAYALEKEGIQPLEKVFREMNLLQTKHGNSFKTIITNKNAIDEQLTEAKNRLGEIDIQYASSIHDLELAQIERHQREQKLKKLQDGLSQLEQQYNTAMASVPAIQDQIQDLNRKIQDISDRGNSLRENHSALEMAVIEPNRNIQALQSRLNTLKDPREIFKARLNHNRVPNSHDIVAAMDWIAQNKGRFQGACYGPIGAELQISNLAVASMVEKVIPIKNLVAFIVENYNDEAILKDFAKKNRYNLNITVMRNQDNLASFYDPHFIDARRREYGLQGHLASQVIAPDLVRTFLNMFAGFHLILWAKGVNISSPSVLTPQAYKELCNNPSQKFRLYVVDVESKPSGSNSRDAGMYFTPFDDDKINQITEITGSKSRYADVNDKPSMLTQPVSVARLLEPGVRDVDGQKKELEDNIHHEKMRLNEMSKELRSTVEELKLATAEGDELRNKVKTFRNSLNVPATIKSKIVSEKKKVSELCALLSIDVDDERRKITNKIKKTVDQLLATLRTVQDKAKSSTDIAVDKIAMSLLARQVGIQLDEAREKLEDAKAHLVQQENLIKTLQRQRDDSNRQVQGAENNLLKLQEDLGGVDRFEALFIRAARELASKTRDELDHAVHVLSGQLDATIENPELLKRYDKLVIELADAIKALDQCNEKCKTALASIEERKNNWLLAVRTITHRLNTLFADFFAALKFTGNIELIETNNLITFEICMNVSFRDGLLMTPLSGQSHSGGERAVSTIMYLMALQDLTSAPFRVVDEINQGMDERNERLVIDRIVRSCCASQDDSTSHATRKSQYFLVTPKLLPGLRALVNDDVTILLIWNGPGVTDKWQLTDIIASLKKRKAELISGSDI